MQMVYVSGKLIRKAMYMYASRKLCMFLENSSASGVCFQKLNMQVMYASRKLI